MSETNYWTRLRRQQISRRRLLRSAALGGVGAAGLALVGCGDDDDEEGAVAEAPAPAAEPAAEPAEEEEEAVAPAAEPAEEEEEAVAEAGPVLLSPLGTDPATARPGGTVAGVSNIGLVQLDPYLSTNSYTILWKNIGDPFMEAIENSTKLRGMLIERTEVPDPLSLLLHVRQGVTFHDKPPVNGRALEARDVVYTLRGASGELFDTPPAVRTSAFFRVSGIDAVDTATARLTFEAPSSVFISGFMGDQRNTAIIPEGLHDAFGGGGDALQEARPERHIGTGPFIPVEYDPVLRVERNPDYWNRPYPFLDAIETVGGIDRATQLAGFISGEWPLLTGLTAFELNIVKGVEADIQFLPPSCCMNMVVFNAQKPVLNDPRLRRAVSLVVNKPGIGGAVMGDDDLWRYPGPLPWSFPEAIPQEDLAERPQYRTPTAADVAEAKKLISAVGLEGDAAFEFTIRTASTGGANNLQLAVEVLLEAVKQLPELKVNLRVEGTGALYGSIRDGDDYDAAAVVFSHEADAALMMRALYTTGGFRNFMRYSNAEIDTLVENVLTTVGDPDRRLALLRDAQELMIEEVPAMQTHHYVTITAGRKNLRDVHNATSNVQRLQYAWFSA